MERQSKSAELENRIAHLIQQAKCEFDDIKKEKCMQKIKELSTQYYQLTGRCYSVENK